MLISTTQTKANRPAMKPAVEITYLQISGTAKAGDTFNLVVRYKAKTTGNLQMRFNFPDSVAPLNRDTNETSRTDTVTISVIDSVYERTYQVKAYGVGKSLVEIEITHLAPPQGMHPKAMKDLGIIHKAATYSTLDPRDIVPDTMQVIKGTNCTKEKGKDKTQSTIRYFSISGKVTYEDKKFQTYRGVYGVRVRAYFYLSGQLYIPSDIDLPEATCDDEGNYSLSFSTTDDEVLNCPQIITFVANYNDAVKLPLRPNLWVLDFMNMYVMDKWKSLKRGFISYNGTSNFTATKDFVLNTNDGAALRYAQMTREFALSKINVSLPVISLTVKPLEVGLAGWFKYPSGEDPYILISPTYVEDIVTIAHEYGHYHNYKFWGSHSLAYEKPISEGWATFFSFAVANYIQVTYEDEFDRVIDNCEIAGHYNKKFENILYSGALYYPGMTQEERVESRDICAFACYLWNLYDGYDDGNDGLQVVSEYDKNDNDDVNGLSDRVFAIMRKGIIRTSTTEDYHGYFKYGLGSIDALPDTLDEAVDRIYNFMFDSDLDNTNKSMSSAQIKAGSLTATRLSATSARLNWLNQEYTNTAENFANFPTSIKIWGAKNYNSSTNTYGDWVNVGAVSHTDKTAVVSLNYNDGIITSQYLAFKVGTYNSKVLPLPGKTLSHNAQVVGVPPNITRKKETKQTIN